MKRIDKLATLILQDVRSRRSEKRADVEAPAKVSTTQQALVAIEGKKSGRIRASKSSGHRREDG